MNLAHHFLLAMPQLHAQPFGDSLVYLLDHDQNGAWGMVVNTPIGMPLREVFEQMDITSDLPHRLREAVLDGGPVEREHGLVLHAASAEYQATRDFGHGVAVSSSRDVLEALSNGTAPERHMVLLGHAGWGPGQLEEEIGRNAWLTCEARLEVLFDTPISQRRDAAAALLGISLPALSAQAGHA